MMTQNVAQNRINKFYCKILVLIIVVCSLFCQTSVAQSFGAANQLLKPLDGFIQASIKKYAGTDLIEEQIATQQNPNLAQGWQVKINAMPVKEVPNALDIMAEFTLLEGTSKETAVSITFDFASWSRNNYVMVPAIVYNGNRYPSIGNGYNPDYPAEMYYNPKVPLTISNNPRLAVEKGKASLVELQTGNTATPAMCFFSPALQKSFMVLTDQKSVFGNHGLSISENAMQNRCSFSITAPAMRKKAPGFGDFHASGDKAPDWKAGDKISLQMRVFVKNTSSIPGLLTAFMLHRKDLADDTPLRNWLPMSYYSGLVTTITSNNFRDFQVGSYYLPENNNDFQLGWVSGMMNSYPMLALNNAEERKRVSEELDFVVNKLQ